MIYEALFWWSTNKVPRSWEMLSIKVCQKVQQAKKNPANSSSRRHFFYYEKLKWQNVKTFCHLQLWFLSICESNLIKTNLRSCNLPISSFNQRVLIEFAPSKSKNVSHWKWPKVVFFISTFVIIEKMSSVQLVQVDGKQDRRAKRHKQQRLLWVLFCWCHIFSLFCYSLKCCAFEKEQSV